jgi:hypothetical protein
MRKQRTRNKSRKINIGFTQDDLKNIEKLRHSLRDLKTFPRNMDAFLNYARVELPVNTNDELEINLKKFTETGDPKHIIKIIQGRSGNWMVDYVIYTVISLARRKYIEAVYEDAKELQKRINKFFREMGLALRGKYNINKISKLFFRL